MNVGVTMWVVSDRSAPNPANAGGRLSYHQWQRHVGDRGFEQWRWPLTGAADLHHVMRSGFRV